MNSEHVKGAPNNAKGTPKDTAGKPGELKFDKPLGSSHNDEADLRDVARDVRDKSK